MQRVLYRARTGVRLGSSATLDREEEHALFLAWEEIGPIFAYAPDEGGCQAVVAMRILFWNLYLHTPPRTDLRSAEAARAYRLHCYKAACQLNHLFYFEVDVTLAVANAAKLGVGLGAVCADVVESLTAILKGAYNDHTARGGRGGMLGAMALQPEVKVVLRVWEWWFLKSHLPLRHHGAPHTVPCTMAKLMATQSPPPSGFSLPPLDLLSPPRGPKKVDVPLLGPSKSPRRPLGMLALLLFMIPCELLFRQSCLILVGQYYQQRHLIFDILINLWCFEY